MSATLLFGSTTTERSSPLILRTRFSMISTNPFLHPINRAESPAERTGPPLVPHFKTHGPICTTLCRLQSIDYRCTEPWDVSAITLSMKIETSETSRVLRTDSFCSVSRRPRRTRWLRSGVSLRTSRAGFPALKTSCRNRRSDSCATTTLLPLEAANERLVDLSGISRHLLELQTCAQIPRQASVAASAGTDDGGRSVAQSMEKAAGGYQRGEAARQRPGLGRCGAAERHAHPARLAGGHRRAVSRARVANGCGRAHCQQHFSS